MKNCPIEFSQKILGGKWKLQIIFNIMLKEQGFNELLRNLAYINAATLNNNLKQLINDGVIDKLNVSQIPPKVSYRLTQSGKSLSPVFIQLIHWGNKMTEQSGSQVAELLRRIEETSVKSE